MPPFLKKLFGRAPGSGLGAERSWIDWAAFDSAVERSPVPTIFVMVMVWAVSAVVLILSGQQQREPLDWLVGQQAPYTILAGTNFSYVDRAATDKARDAAEAEASEYFKLDSERSNKITRNFADFVAYVETRLDDRETKRQHGVVQDSLPAKLASEISPTLCEAIRREYRRGTTYAAFHDQLNRIVKRGILGSDVQRSKGKDDAQRNIRIVDNSGRISLQLRKFSDFHTPATAAELLANSLFPTDKNCGAEFRRAALKLIGDNGNLNCDHELTTESREQARKKIPDVIKEKQKGEVLIAKGTLFDAAKKEIIAAEREALPPVGDLWRTAATVLIWSLLLLGAAIAFQYWLDPCCFGDNRRIIVLGLTVIAALVLNDQTLGYFEYLLRQDKIKSDDLLVAAVPIALAPAMISVLLDRRAAIGAGAYVAAITAMMIMPERSFELALRWTAVTTVTALLVSRVDNYRAFFLHTLVASIGATWLICLDRLFLTNNCKDFLQNAVWVIFCSGFAAAVLSLALIFFLEVVGNFSTRMSLMVLCDCNHPLLERMKREAPGTMAHSMAVATLSEDAARAIGANPLIAKAGALFHDVGKLTMPQYFTENNPDSALQHLNLNPQMSSIIIRDHVKEGLLLARRYRLCREVRDIIATHHGDDLVRYFYNKMLENAKNDTSAPPVLESQFRYGGEPPRGIEATIVSLADACEAASRSLEHPTPERIRDLVGKIFLGRFQGGQLRRSLLPLADLEKVRESFIATLSSARHGRVSYDTPAAAEQKGTRSETALPVAQSAPSASPKK